LTRAARREIAALRVTSGEHASHDREEAIASAVAAILALEKPRATPVINATGVVIHTNLGRAPVSHDTAEAMAGAASSTVALEVEPETGMRGGRMCEISDLLHLLTGSEAALVVNNCASAVLLALAATSSGKSVVVSRGEAVEIGGGFRIPDVLRQSGAQLAEVGTTNRTYVRDYADASDESTSAFLKVHPSNFRSSGFVHAVSTIELATLARERNVLLLEDLGSGALLDTARFGLAHEPTLSEAIAAGADVVMASGDKLLGGPQAGIIVGKAAAIAQVERHPLARAVRADKTTLAGIAATLRHYAFGEAERRIPIWRMIAANDSDVRDRAEKIAANMSGSRFEVSVAETRATVGGGSMPGETLPSWSITLATLADEETNLDQLAHVLRISSPAIYGRIERGRLVLDLRTVLPEDDERFTEALRQVLSGNPR
jgi:L-seryl-tRNA(Ser) seleniumtransferase